MIPHLLPEMTGLLRSRTIPVRNTRRICRRRSGSRVPLSGPFVKRRTAAWFRLTRFLVRYSHASPLECHTNFDCPRLSVSLRHLSIIVALIGVSGAGKSSSNGVARELQPLDRETVIQDAPIGSGEGLVEMLFEMVAEGVNDKGKPIKVKKQVYRNAHVYVDEGSALVALAQRKDSLVLSTLRTIYSGGVLGQSNASQDTRRRVEGNEHTFGIVIAIQDVIAAALIEHEADGTPQRFLWMSAIDPSVPTIPPEWPGAINALDFLQQPERTGGLDSETVKRVKTRGLGYMRIGESFEIGVDEAIKAEMRAGRLSTVHGKGDPDPMKAHANLTRLKVAGCFAILDQRVEINPEDWRLAGMVMKTSNAVLARTRQAIAENEQRQDAKTSARAAHRQVIVADALDERAALKQRVDKCAIFIRNRVQDQPGTTVSALRRGITARLRDAFDDGLTRALAQGWVKQRIEPTTAGGNDRRALYPGGEEE